MTGGGWFLETLRVKVLLVALILVLSGTHDFVIGPRLANMLDEERGPETVEEQILQYRRAVSWLARINLFLALAIPGLSVLLVRGNPF